MYRFVPDCFNKFFQETSVHSYEIRFVNMENYFTHRVSSNAGKNEFRIGELPSGLRWKKIVVLFAVNFNSSHFLNIKEAKQISCLLASIKFHKILLSFVVLCFFVFFLFLNVWVCVILLLHIGLVRHILIGHCDPIALGFVHVPASEKKEKIHYAGQKLCCLCVAVKCSAS